MQMLKQSTAATILVGPVLDASGAAVTTAVIGDFQATKNGTSAALASPATATHSHNGFYLLALTTGNTDTVGRLVISVNNTAQSMSTHRYTVLLPSVFDALITNATNTSGGLPAATGAISALAGAVSTYAGGDTAGTTTLLTRLPSAISLSSGAVTVGTNNDKTGYSLTAGTGLGNQTANITGNLSGSVGSVTGSVGSVTARVTANTDQWGGVAVTGMPMPTYTQPTGFLAATFPATVSSYAGGAVASVTGAVGSVTSPVTVGTNNDKTGYSLTQAFPANFASLAITVGGAVTAGTVSDKTGYSLSSSGLAAVTSWTVGITGNITGNVSGSVGSISGVTFPTHFDNLDITANGHVTATVDAINNNAITASSIQANAITAAKIATDAIGAAQLAANAAAEVATATRTELAVELSRMDAAVTSRAAASDMATLLSRIGAFTGAGVNTVLGFLKAIASKAASTPSDIGGTFSATTDSVEAIRDAMQAGTGDASQATLVQVQGTVDAIAASLSGTAINVVSRVADGGNITLYAGDDMRVRSGTEVAVTISDVGGAIYSRLNTIGIANLAFGASRPSQPAGAIDGTVAALSQAGAGAAQTVTIDIEITDGGQGLAYSCGELTTGGSVCKLFPASQA